jgi:hypothetical protein
MDGGCEAWLGFAAAHAASSVPLRKSLRVRLRSRQMTVRTSRAVRDGRSGPEIAVKVDVQDSNYRRNTAHGGGGLPGFRTDSRRPQSSWRMAQGAFRPI